MSALHRHLCREIVAIGCAAALLAVAARAESLPGAPPAGVPALDTFFGTTVEDPWRHLEQTSAADVAAWMQSEAGRTRALLDALPGRAELLQRIGEIEGAAPERIFSVERLPGDSYRYLKRIPGDNGLRIYRRDGAHGRERMLVDLDPWIEMTGHSHAFSLFSSSPLGRRLAYGLTESGSEAATLRVIDTTSRAELIAPIDRIDLNSGESGDTGIGWLPDESGFFFNRLAPGSEARPAAERYQWSEVFLRRFGRPEDERVPVFGGHAVRGVRFEASDVSVAFVPTVETLALGLVVHGTRREFSLYSAALSAVVRGHASWRRLFGPEAKVTSMSLHGRDMFLLTHSDAPRFKVTLTSLIHPDIAGARTIYAPERGILATIASAHDGLYLKVRDGMNMKLLRIAHASGSGKGKSRTDAKAEEIPLPAAGAFDMVNPDGRIAG
ncbi:MAG: hypothetical protein ABI854_10605, partial [Betaproteobacteria bacterium]